MKLGLLVSIILVAAFYVSPAMASQASKCWLDYSRDTGAWTGPGPAHEEYSYGSNCEAEALKRLQSKCVSQNYGHKIIVHWHRRENGLVVPGAEEHQQWHSVDCIAPTVGSGGGGSSGGGAYCEKHPNSPRCTGQQP